MQAHKTKPESQSEFTNVKMKPSVVFASCDNTSVALLASHEPDDVVRLGFRFTTSWIVWPESKRQHIMLL